MLSMARQAAVDDVVDGETAGGGRCFSCLPSRKEGPPCDGLWEVVQEGREIEGREA
jgi:hypothetical protein